jgi:phosphatidylglycerophosphatase A
MMAMPRIGLVERTARLVATSGGAGFVPRMPGTAGAAVGVLLYLGMVGLEWSWLYLPAILVLTIAGVWAAGRVEGVYGHDAPVIVIDEVVGQLIAFGSVAASGSGLLAHTVLGFALFRFFDILKPFPIRRLEAFSGGFGVMADDIGAGVFALLAARILERLMEIL